MTHVLAIVVRAIESSLIRRRINKAAQDEETGAAAAAGGDSWILGQFRDRGSLHSDIWRGSAAALASRDAIGVFPVGGWWKEKPSLQRWDRSARYALLVSIRAPEATVDLYTAIVNQLVVQIPAAQHSLPTASPSEPHRSLAGPRWVDGCMGMLLDG